MTEPSDAAKRKACELANPVAEELRSGRPANIWGPTDYGHPEEGAFTAFARYIQATSDVAKSVRDVNHPLGGIPQSLQSLILPDEPERIRFDMRMTPDQICDAVKRALAAGKVIKIVEAGHE